jgi:hypothetical protein
MHHPNQPDYHVFVCVQLWDWDKGWDCTQVFEGHAHYVMMVRHSFDTKTDLQESVLASNISYYNLLIAARRV